MDACSGLRKDANTIAQARWVSHGMPANMAGCRTYRAAFHLALAQGEKHDTQKHSHSTRQDWGGLLGPGIYS
jgi:hypothetical protein